MRVKRFLHRPIVRRLAARPEVRRRFAEAAANHMPVVVIAYDNAVYVERMVSQLNALDLRPLLLDNASTHAPSVRRFGELHDRGRAVHVRCPVNVGHNLPFMRPVYDLLPDLFAVTDPDLRLSESLPPDFLDVLAAVTDEYMVFKAGMALELREPFRPLTITVRRRWPLQFRRTYGVVEWERQFWQRRLDSRSGLEVYAADVDTTFCVVNKRHFHGRLLDGVRVAGKFGCLHLPWYPDIDVMSEEEREFYARSKRDTAGAWIRH